YLNKFMKIIHWKIAETKIWQAAAADVRKYNARRKQQEQGPGARTQLSKAKVIEEGDKQPELEAARARRAKTQAAAARKLAREEEKKKKRLEEILKEIRVAHAPDEN